MSKHALFAVVVAGVAAVAAILLLAGTVSTEVPLKVSYQGRLTDDSGQPLKDTTVAITFSIYRSDGTQVWTSGPRSVQVNNGLFNYVLGSNVELPLGVISNQYQRFLGIKVGSDPEMSPRTEIISVPYAYRSQTSDTATVSNNGVPVGTVIDWWRPNVSFPVPDGFQICDGSTVADPESPLNGFALPDLRNHFVFGATSATAIGVIGGSASHTHDHDHPAFAHTHDIPATSTTSGYTSLDHTHLVDPPSSSTSNYTHSHEWSHISVTEDWYSYLSDGSGVLMYDHPVGGNGVAGSNNTFPIAIADADGNITVAQHFYTAGDDHGHSVDINSFTSGPASVSLNHAHQISIGSSTSGTADVDLPNITSTSASTMPPYVALLKIMKIK